MSNGAVGSPSPRRTAEEKWPALSFARSLSLYQGLCGGWAIEGVGVLLREGTSIYYVRIGGDGQQKMMRREKEGGLRNFWDVMIHAISDDHFCETRIGFRSWGMSGKTSFRPKPLLGAIENGREWVKKFQIFDGTHYGSP